MYRFVPDAAWDEPRRGLLYAFSGQNPLRYLDPDGRFWSTVKKVAKVVALSNPIVAYNVAIGSEVHKGATGQQSWGKTGKRVAQEAAVMVSNIASAGAGTVAKVIRGGAQVVDAALSDGPVDLTSAPGPGPGGGAGGVPPRGGGRADGGNAAAAGARAGHNGVYGPAQETRAPTNAESSRAGQEQLTITYPDGSIKKITAERVKEQVPATHPDAPPGTMINVKFRPPERKGGSDARKRRPTADELKHLDRKQ
ncbi:MAG: hypothetical protein HS111_20900 [Kofleriaceae bacterium]|nr:hypothetical protein [Kofleriaceae bacterium]